LFCLLGLESRPNNLSDGQQQAGLATFLWYERRPQRRMQAHCRVGLRSVKPWLAEPCETGKGNRCIGSIWPR
jgi:hypothetical protein